MTARTRAAALALVNWKGVFYERYLLDRHVTALEGANGAGKTTVMIAAYVVLLPDMSRLRFTTLGETGGGSADKGIWGRLGEPERPSYAALDLILSNGERAILGVQLERRAEPAVDVTPFLVSELDPEQRLQDLLLKSEGEYDHVPLLEELRENAARCQARLQVFSTTKDYFAALFERGITPLRLSTDEDRNKLNEMLKTSMTGGISRALTSELRSFLLKEELGLSDTLSRMRENLEACRRTRGEVAEARRLEQEINGIYDAGQGMFSAALQASRLGYEEASAELLELQKQHERTAERARSLAALAAQLTARRDALAERAASAEAAVSDAHKAIERVERARAAKSAAEQLERELAELAQDCRVAREAQVSASDSRLALQKRLESARTDYERAARGVADLQSGLDELHRRAHAHRTALETLDRLRCLLEEPDLSPSDLGERAALARARLDEIDRERARLDRVIQSAEAAKKDRALAMAALAEIDPNGSDETALERARSALSRLSELEARILHEPEVIAELETAERLARRQAAVRERARALPVDPGADTAESVSLSVALVEQKLGEAETEAWHSEQCARSEAALADEASRAAERIQAELRTLELRSARLSALQDQLARLASAHNRPCSNARELEELREWLGGQRERLRVHDHDLSMRREALLGELASLEGGVRGVHPELQSLCDELSGELLAERYEDLEPAVAARVEAELGPVVHGLIVEDPEGAARAIAGRPRELSTIFLLNARCDLAALRAPTSRAPQSNDVIVLEPHGVRITRISERPALGRLARQRLVEELSCKLSDIDVQLENAFESARELEGTLPQIDRILQQLRELEPALPPNVLSSARAELERAALVEREHRTQAALSFETADRARARTEALRALLPEAFLLDAGDYGERANELGRRRASIAEARAELSRVARARHTLSSLLDSLRSEPPTREHLEVLAEERAALDGERDRWFAVMELLGEFPSLADALANGGADSALEQAGGVLPALKARLSQASIVIRERELALTESERDWDARTRVLQQAEARHGAASAHLERARKELAELGVADVSDAALRRAENALSEARAALTAVAQEQRTLDGQLAVHRERLSLEERAASEVEARLHQATRERAEPAKLAWEELRANASSARVLEALLVSLPKPSASVTSTKAWAAAESRRELLCDRLSDARAHDTSEEIRKGDPSEGSGNLYLAAWLRARDWLKRRLPAHVAEVEDPIEGLDRLRAHLAGLEQRLARQELDLRGTSEDVARSIDVQIRRAKTQVRRLNQHLSGVSFGSIHGIRVQMGRVERMDQILRALRDGSAQELLFHPGLPIEEALGEIFRRYGGGRTGGQRLLDYREYVALSVEIQRRANPEWEAANPSRLSTGEAIGVGAALMMVVLTEWERDANLLRPKHGGSLRFLFLDEANRLSQDNLGVLFELCQNLDLQLLIAAPEVARARGNTTYRLVRVLTEDGREEVLVSGRRSLDTDSTDANACDTPSMQAEPPATQGDLFES